MADRDHLTEHARLQALRRGISETAIREVAASPEQTLRLGRHREVRQSRATDPTGGKLQLLRVIVELSERGYTIITAYRTSKIRKYWRV